MVPANFTEFSKKLKRTNNWAVTTNERDTTINNKKMKEKKNEDNNATHRWLIINARKLIVLQQLQLSALNRITERFRLKTLRRLRPQPSYLVRPFLFHFLSWVLRDADEGRQRGGGSCQREREKERRLSSLSLVPAYGHCSLDSVSPRSFTV